jgi:ABC-type nickel/cobalt efflux system permease component RcnA
MLMRAENSALKAKSLLLTTFYIIIMIGYVAILMLAGIAMLYLGDQSDFILLSYGSVRKVVLAGIAILTLISCLMIVEQIDRALNAYFKLGYETPIEEDNFSK